MIKSQAQQLMQRLTFPIEAQTELLSKLDLILQTPKYANAFLAVLDIYNKDRFNFDTILRKTKSLAKKVGICEYTAYMLLFVCLAPKLYERYKQNGISDEIFYNTMLDLKYKLEECRLIYSKVGTFVETWLTGLFEMKIFGIGRLQYKIAKTDFDCDVDGLHIPKGTKAICVHIPRTGTKLEHTLVLESYKMAAEFFADQLDGRIIFICTSWLLYPWNRTVLSEKSNIAAFYDDFTIVKEGNYSNYNEVWRLFDCLYDGNPNNLPNDTSLRKAYIERIKENKPLGYGTGVLVYKK